jgi:hypothetical protein
VASREDLERTYNRLARQIMSGTSDGGVDEHDAESSVKRGQLLGDIAGARGAGAQVDDEVSARSSKR